ncbi:MAG: ABC transporter permease [Actinomycetota bacterium]
MPVRSPDPEGIVAESSMELIVEAVDADAEPEREVKTLGSGFWVAVSWLGILTLAAILAPYIPGLPDPTEISADLKQPPSTEYWFGTDDLGRDMFSRVIWGGRVSLFIGVASVGLGFLIGGTIGLTAGYFGGRYEKVAMGAMDVMLAFPALVLALALISVLNTDADQGASIGQVVLILTILSVPALARITRAATLSYAQREFVTAARALGARRGRILWQEILPNVVPPMASFALTAVAIVIVAEGTLSFLGLSVASPTSTWGKLIQEGSTSLDDAPWIALIPCAVMFATLLGLNYAGDKLQSYFDVRESAI